MIFVLISGPPAVGKMTVGKELARQTGLKLFHNHVSLELANRFFDFSTPSFKRLSELVRFGVFEEVAGSELKGLVFTYTWAFNYPEDEAYVDRILEIFRKVDAQICLVDLETPMEVRLQRNRHPDRLKEKPSKRNLELSDQLLQYDEEKYRLNALPGEFPDKPIFQVDNSRLSPAEAVAIIREHFGI